MDWNKSNTILIIAFIILNIFLLAESFGSIFINNEINGAMDEEYQKNIENLLENKNIDIKCEIPKGTSVMPILYTEYSIVEINDTLVQTYLGEGIKAQDGVFVYSNDKGETLEIKESKKIIYTVRERVPAEYKNGESADSLINDFISKKKIDNAEYSEAFRYVSEEGGFVAYTKKYGDYDIDNSYMNFYLDAEGIYKFEMQSIDLTTEIKDKIRTISALEALPRLMAYDDIRNKDIVEIKLSYYSKEDENWQYITETNSDPTWKVIFSDGTQRHLPSFD